MKEQVTGHWLPVRMPTRLVTALLLALLIGLVRLGCFFLPERRATPVQEAPATAVLALPPATERPPTAAPTPTATQQPTATPTRPAASAPPTRIVAPAIGLDAPVIEASWGIVLIGDKEAKQWEVPLNMAGFHSGTAFPGNPGNTVISGHHNMGSEVFRYLVDLAAGDEIILYAGESSYRYRVTDTLVLQEFGVSDEQRIDNARWIAPSEDERLTLVTCWPYSGNSHRVIVVARPLF